MSSSLVIYEEPSTYFRIAITPLLYYVFDRSEVKYFHRTDLKANLEIVRLFNSKFIINLLYYLKVLETFDYI